MFFSYFEVGFYTNDRYRRDNWTIPHLYLNMLYMTIAYLNKWLLAWLLNCKIRYRDYDNYYLLFVWFFSYFKVSLYTNDKYRTDNWTIPHLYLNMLYMTIAYLTKGESGFTTKDASKWFSTITSHVLYFILYHL